MSLYVPMLKPGAGRPREVKDSLSFPASMQHVFSYEGSTPSAGLNLCQAKESCAHTAEPLQGFTMWRT